MNTDNAKQNPSSEVEPLNEAELGEEMLEGINGGIIVPLIDQTIKPHLPNKPKDPEGSGDGGASGSW